jgi:hypothetical protein
MATGYSTDQTQPTGAIPVWLAGGNFNNITTSQFNQVKVGPGVLSGLVIGTAGTSSAVAFYDGLSSAVTVTIATPGVVTWPSHGLPAGSAVVFETSGALPTGLTAGTTYYVSITGLTANSFQVAATQAFALAGTNSIATSGSQSGVQTGWNISVPIGTLVTTAQNNLPFGVNGAMFVSGLIARTTDSGGAANITVLYR